jgi:hypothetical protein
MEPQMVLTETVRLFALAVALSLAAFAAASAQPATPDSENGRYSFNALADGVLRLDTRTGQVSQCIRSDAGWTCKAVPDERSSLETEIARLQGENATLKKELLAHGLPAPGVSSPPGLPAASRNVHQTGIDRWPDRSILPAGSRPASRAISRARSWYGSGRSIALHLAITACRRNPASAS